MVSFRVTLLLIIVGVSNSSMGANECRGGGFTNYSEDYYVYKVVKDKAFYYYDWEACPTDGKCKKNRYLIKGDSVLVSKLLNNKWACVRNLDKRKVRHGWVKLTDLKPVAEKKSIGGIKRWEGLWTNCTTGALDIRAKNNETWITGSAIWNGGEHASNNEGSVKGKLVISRDIESAYVRSGKEEYDCLVNMKLITNKYMVVTDNKQCGGTNVRFDGIYVRE